jgi:diguanylate cyclase (GGDEF)-like protein
MARAERHDKPLALLLVDLDNFKAINDGHRHAAGDAALRRVAAIARDTLRAIDCVAHLAAMNSSCCRA